MSARYASFALAMAAAMMPLHADAQADNSNSFTAPGIPLVAPAGRHDITPLMRWWRDDARRRETVHVPRESLTAAELGLLYGTDFALAPGAEGPAPMPAP